MLWIWFRLWLRSVQTLFAVSSYSIAVQGKYRQRYGIRCYFRSGGCDANWDAWFEWLYTLLYQWAPTRRGLLAVKLGNFMVPLTALLHLTVHQKHLSQRHRRKSGALLVEKQRDRKRSTDIHSCRVCASSICLGIIWKASWVRRTSQQMIIKGGRLCWIQLQVT